ncbi:MAG: PilZ domain-containing protein [Candidatus Sulfotelmatobacter sp.]
MPDENSAGAAYLAALKQSTPQAAGAAPARAPVPSSESRDEGAAPAGTANSALNEMRRSPRYRCQGSARLREIGSGAATWATFTDISLHGCYVEAMSTFRVGTGLDLTIEVNGYRVVSQGEVRVAYPNLGMGICFTTISVQDRERLRELLRSLSRPSVILSSRAAANAAAAPPADLLSSIANPGVALQAIVKFFDDRHMLSQEEFLRILRKSQSSGK